MTTFKATALTLCIAITGGFLIAAPPASAQFAVFDPVNYIQNFLTQLRNVQSNINEAQQLANQIQQYRNMLQNTESLAGGDWAGMNNAISRLDALLQQGQSLAVSGSNYEKAFSARFPGYSPTNDYVGSYRQWSDTSMDSILGAMRVANMQVQGIADERQALSRLRAAASTSEGQKAALDASNQIALSQVEQLQQLRELMVAQMQAQGTYMAATEQKEAADQSRIDASLQRANVERQSNSDALDIPAPAGW
jgi:P-type conjugative transfer protein TrbJ